MTSALPVQTREPRIEEPTNVWIIHPAGRRLLRWCLAAGLSANAMSLCGLAIGGGAALAYFGWGDPRACLLGLALSVGWLIADGLDGMIARATGTASPLGRFLDGLCDHGVFIAIYVALAWSIGTAEGWTLAIVAGACHAVQSNIYEGERARFHRRQAGLPAEPIVPAGNALVRIYDSLGAGVDRSARAFDVLLSHSADRRALADAYTPAAIPPMRLMCLLSANTRVQAIFIACIAGDPRAFWWFEITALSAILLIGFAWHRAVESRFVRPRLPECFPMKDVTRP